MSYENATRVVMELSKIQLSLPAANSKPCALASQPGLGGMAVPGRAHLFPGNSITISIAAGGLSDLELAPRGLFKLQALGSNKK